MPIIDCHISSLTVTHATDELTELSAIAPMQRRRLTALAKLALHTAHKALAGSAVDVIIWSSCCGDEMVTAQILKDIAAAETPSPTLFSVSVHNAIGGLYSILYSDDTPATSLSSAPNRAISDAIIEAYSTLRTTGATRALVVYYEAPLPDIYAQSDAVVDAPLAVGFIVSTDGRANLTFDSTADAAISVHDFIGLCQDGLTDMVYLR